MTDAYPVLDVLADDPLALEEQEARRMTYYSPDSESFGYPLPPGPFAAKQQQRKSLPAFSYRVGIVGVHGTGKSTFARALAEATGKRLLTFLQGYPDSYDIRNTSFAKSLRENLKDVPWPYSMDAARKRSANERSLLQVTGEAFRDFDKNWYLHQALNETQPAAVSKPTLWIHDDVYHLNEAFSMDSLIIVSSPSDIEELTSRQSTLSVSERETLTLLRLFDNNNHTLIPSTSINKIWVPLENEHSYPTEKDVYSVAKGIAGNFSYRVEKYL